MKRSRPEAPIAVRVGDTEVLMIGRRRIRFDDPYHYVLTLTWPRFYVLIVAVFVVINLLFGLAFWASPGSVASARADHFFDYFFFSVETLATVGYGVMSPATTYGHVVASIEILLGMMLVALITGLVFARFSRPRARIEFADRCVVRPFEGVPHLMVRLANERSNRIVEASATLSLVSNETMDNGEIFVRIRDLPLTRSTSPVFALTWTLTHRIDESSPLFGLYQSTLAARRSRLIVSVTGHDETMAATIYATESYLPEDIAFGHRYVDVIRTTEDGQRVIDLTHFHGTEPIA